MSNIFPIKELEEHKQYLIATDCYDKDQFSFMIMDSDGLVVHYNTLRNELDFEQEVEKWAEYYNCVDIKEFKSVPRENIVHGNGGKIKLSEEFKKQLKKSFDEYCNKRDLNWNLIEEIKLLKNE